MAAFLTTLFLGVVVGSIYSLSAFGLVLTYRASGVFNFAHGAIGMFGAYVFYQLVQGGSLSLVFMEYTQTWHLPTGVALVVVLGVIAPALGWLLDIALFRRLRDAGEVVKIVATIGLLVALQGLAGVMWGAGTTLTPTSIFSPAVWTIGGFRAEVEQIATVALAVTLAVALVGFLRYSTLGVKMRAVVDRADLVELSGIDSARVSGVSWAIGTSFGALSGILLAPFFGSLDPITLTFFIVAATAAAIAGRLQSFYLTLAGGFGIGVSQLIVQRYASNDIARQLMPAIPFIVLFGLLFLPQWRRRPTDRWTVPPLPPVMRSLSPKDAATRIGIVTVVAVLAPFLLNESWQLHLSRVPAVALIFLSLVVVCGFGGQISLCQASLAGLGAFVCAHLVADAGLPFLLAVVLGGFAVVPVGVFIALRAANLSPLFLGFATLAFGAVMDEIAFSSGSFSGGLSGIFFGRPDWIGSSRAFYLFALAMFGVVALLVQNLRRSQTGLALGAMRDSEVGLGALGVDVARLKLTAFSMSALIAGMGGGLLSAADELATPFSYFKFQSLLFLTLAVIGGIGSWLGAFAGAVVFQLIPPFVHESFVRDNVVTRTIVGDNLEALLPVFFGLGAIGLARNPHGLVEQIRVWFTPRGRMPVTAEHARRVCSGRWRCHRCLPEGNPVPPPGMRARSGKAAAHDLAARQASTVSGVPPMKAVERWIAQLPESATSELVRPGFWYIRIPGTARSWIPVEIDVRVRSIKLTSHVIIEPEENHAEVFRFLLRRNHSAGGPAFSIDGKEGVICLVTRLPREGLDEMRLDEAIGTIVQETEEVFRTILAVGFASRLRKR